PKVSGMTARTHVRTSLLIRSRIPDSPVHFGRPEGKVIRSVEMLVIPAQFLLALRAGQPRPLCPLIAHRASQMFVILLRIFRFVGHGNNSVSGGWTSFRFSKLVIPFTLARASAWRNLAS